MIKFSITTNLKKYTRTKKDHPKVVFSSLDLQIILEEELISFALRHLPGQALK